MHCPASKNVTLINWPQNDCKLVGGFVPVPSREDVPSSIGQSVTASQLWTHKLLQLNVCVSVVISYIKLQLFKKEPSVILSTEVIRDQPFEYFNPLLISFVIIAFHLNELSNLAVFGVFVKYTPQIS